MNPCPLMGGRELEHALQRGARLPGLARLEPAEGHHVVAVHPVQVDRILVEHEEVREGYGEVVHAHVVVQMASPVVDEAPEQGIRLVFLARLPSRETLIA
jgi:hypothetical protein